MVVGLQTELAGPVIPVFVTILQVCYLYGQTIADFKDLESPVEQDRQRERQRGISKASIYS